MAVMASMKNLFRVPLIMPRGTRALIPRMFISSSSNPPVPSASEGNATQTTSNETNSALEESRGISSSAVEDTAGEEIQDSCGSAKETAQKVQDSVTGKAEESKESMKQCAETVRRAMNNKEC